VAYVPGIVFNGGVPVPVRTHPDNGWQLNVADVEAAVTPRTKALFLGYPCNPTGAVLAPETLRGLADLARRHDLIVISDEIYDRLVYGGHRHEPISSLEGMRERTIMLGGFSKAYAMTGWRVGYACAPRDLLEGMLKVHQYNIMSAPTTAQDAALVALTAAEQDVTRMVGEYDRRRKMFVEGLNRIGLPAVEPKGAFYAFPNIRSSGLTSDQFSERLLFEQNVAVIPGSAFGPSGEGHVRATLATSYDNLEEALVRIERFMGTLH
jgi:aminotransferase